jgi:hypothetical protein
VSLNSRFISIFGFFNKLLATFLGRIENFLGIVSRTRACGRIARLVRRPFHSSFNRKVAVNTLLLFAFWAVFPSLYGFNLSGRNWAIGLPFAWITFRPNFPGLNYGGHLNFDLELAVPNLAVAFLCSVGIQKLVQIAFNRSPREGSVYLTGVFYLVVLFMNPLLVGPDNNGRGYIWSNLLPNHVPFVISQSREGSWR